MANINVTLTKIPDAWGAGTTDPVWSQYNVSGKEIPIKNAFAFYLLYIAQNEELISCNVTVNIKSTAGWLKGSNIRCTAFKGDSPGNTHASDIIGETTVELSAESTETTQEFTLNNLNVAGLRTVSIMFDSIPHYNAHFTVSAPVVSYTIAVPEISLNVTPATVITGNQITGTITNPYSQSFTVQIRNGNTLLDSFTASGASFTRTATDELFTKAGISGNSMPVVVSISDSLTRTASQQITVRKPTAGTVHIIGPTGTTENGTQKITLSWSYSGDGTQAKAETQYRYSNSTWETLLNFDGSGTNVVVPTWWFRSGTVYWRVRAQNSFGLWSEWAQTSFGVSYPTLSLTALPKNVFAGFEAVNLTFTNRESRTLTVVFKQSNTILQSLSVSADTYSITPPASWFEKAGISSNSMSVTVAVSDSVNRTATDTFTLKKPTGRTATATTPSGSTVNGAATIAFSWSSSGDGTQKKSELQQSTDQVTWTALASIPDNASTWTAPADKFPSGRVYWRVRVYSSFDLWGEWSDAKNFTVQYDAVSQVVPVNSPTSGVYNAAADRVFSVALQASGPVYEPFQISAATMYWRAGESGDFTAITMTPGGNTASATVAAGTFPSGRIEWYASATDTTGRTTETEHYVLTALQTEVEAAPLSPVNTVESGNGPIVFRWTYNSLDGSTQSRAQLQYSQDGTTWDDEDIFADVQDAATIYTAPANTFPGGAIYWRVRSYNGAGTAGPWSDAASVTIFAAPVVAGVTGDGKPFATISWQTEGQEAYEVEVDGKVYGPYFGADARSFKIPEPLADGTYTVRVRAQNQYSLWSTWARAEMSVTNVPGRSGWLVAEGGENVRLHLILGILAPTITRQPQDVQGTTGTVYVSLAFYPTAANPVGLTAPSRQWYYREPGGEWNLIAGATNYRVGVECSPDIDGRQYRCRVYNDAGEIYSRAATYHYAAPSMQIGTPIEGVFYAETGYFLVYRGNKLIGKTYDYEFVDRTSLGENTYKFVQVLQDGYYTEIIDQNTATASVDCPMIAPLEDRDAAFIPLPYVENYNDGVTINRSVNTVKTQFSGAKYPTVEIGEGQTYSASLGTFWLDGDTEDADKLEALLKKPVILKTPRGRVLVGVLDRLPSLDLYYKRAYTISLEQMEWSDFVDDVPRN